MALGESRLFRSALGREANPDYGGDRLVMGTTPDIRSNLVMPAGLVLATTVLGCGGVPQRPDCVSPPHEPPVAIELAEGVGLLSNCVAGRLWLSVSVQGPAVLQANEGAVRLTVDGVELALSTQQIDGRTTTVSYSSDQSATCARHDVEVTGWWGAPWRGALTVVRGP